MVDPKLKFRSFSIKLVPHGWLFILFLRRQKKGGATESCAQRISHSGHYIDPSFLFATNNTLGINNYGQLPFFLSYSFLHTFYWDYS